ncbi:insecticidal toxin complex protein TccC [Providencia alcalifaciens]|uniref:Insecticidal toxin complex protein TccC n=1 Tax=Providencia alcalifaciens TaxID=126385 RepID=A0A4R3NF53_9GAMM|nr:insecticidal toxin complex protein TccC [Providencia alcalifaciens]
MHTISASVFEKTPTVTVLDNRGLNVRNVEYYRHPDTPAETEPRITRHQYDARGALIQSVDSRLHDAGRINFHYLTDLSGKTLHSQGVDNGITVTLNDAAGRPYIAVSNIDIADDGTEDRSQALTRRWQYEDEGHSGRLLRVTEQVTGEAPRTVERFLYAGNRDADKALNLSGQCICHYDTAGLIQTDSIALTGEPLSLSRRLLKNADNPDTVADWQGEDESIWREQLDTEVFTTKSVTDATGAMLMTQDAEGNLQRVAYNIAGQLSGSWLTLKGRNEQIIVASLTYSAAGQKLREVHGNGVVTTYSYETETQRLTGIKTERPVNHLAGGKVLQDLRYEYDPVGNVLKITNDAEETRFWRNQKVVPENTYTYDSLYQLIRATGREMANISQQGNHSPAALVPFPTDNAAYTNYTRTYSYDSAGNMTQIRHRAPMTSNNYTTQITVSHRSNRGVLSTLTENPADVETFFTAGGQQQQLQPGQLLVWAPRNELLKINPVQRDGHQDDSENYRYDSNSQRIVKISTQKTRSSTQTQRVIYLQGLEYRITSNGLREIENLQVITVGEAGRAQVRVLHWVRGKPEEIENDSMRYSYDNLIGSSGLEVDGNGNIISIEEYYPYGGSSVWSARSQIEANYKTVRYSGKERDATGLYYYGYRYYQPWVGRWLSSDPAGTVDGMNLFRMVRNNPILLHDPDGKAPNKKQNARNTIPSEPSSSARTLIDAVNKIPEEIPQHVSPEDVKRTGRIPFFKKFFLQKKRDTDKALSVAPDKDFEPVNISQSDVDRGAAPLHGPVNLRKPFDHKRWVTNDKEIVVYRQDNRSLDEIINAGGFYPRTLEIGTLEDHSQGSTKEYSFVSTSDKRLKGGSYGKYEYKIKLNPHQAVHLPATLDRIHGRLPQKYRINEYSVPGFITPLQIVGWRKC